MDIQRPPLRCIVVGNSNASVEAAHEVRPSDSDSITALRCVFFSSFFLRKYFPDRRSRGWSHGSRTKYRYLYTYAYVPTVTHYARLPYLTDRDEVRGGSHHPSPVRAHGGRSGGPEPRGRLVRQPQVALQIRGGKGLAVSFFFFFGEMKCVSRPKGTGQYFVDNLAERIHVCWI